MSDPIIGGMAAIPERYDQLEDVVSRITPQVDRLIIGVSHNYEPLVQEALKEHDNVELVVFRDRHDDSRKFVPFAKNKNLNVPEDFYFFAFDDDLIYPEDYTKRMIEYITKWKREAAVCVHGSWIPLLPCESYYQDKRAVHFQQSLSVPLQVLFPGTGTLAFHTETQRLYLAALALNNVADVQYGRFANARNTPVLAVPRPQNWVRQHPNIDPTQNSIWARRRNADEKETDLINEYEEAHGWTFPPAPHS